MADPMVERWKPSGRIAMWRCSGEKREWNLCADSEACDALIQLVDLMADARWPSKVRLNLTTPELTANGMSKDFHFAKSVTIAYPQGRVADEHWKFESANGLALEMGLAKLAEFRNAIADIRAGNGDYTIGTDAQPLWVWWWVNVKRKKTR